MTADREFEPGYPTMAEGKGAEQQKRYERLSAAEATLADMESGRSPYNSPAMIEMQRSRVANAKATLFGSDA